MREISPNSAMENPKVQEVSLFFCLLSLSVFVSVTFRIGYWVVSCGTQILEKQLLTVAKAVEEKLDDEISALDRLDDDDLEALRERRLQQMKKMAEKRSRWISLGHGEYSEIPFEKDFFAAVKASDRVVCHFYRENWPCKVLFVTSVA